jgi:DNA mismatch repair ATPase MutS
MKIEDDVVSKKSKYYVEAERLLFVQEMLRSNLLLCLIDEILTGTNTEDRIKASLGLLRNYSKYPNSIILAATHDNIIAEDLKSRYSSYFFDGELKNGKIEYDYAIKQGIVTNRNAIHLLRYLGLGID